MTHETESPRRRFLKQAGVSSGLAASALLPAPTANAQSSPPRAPASDALTFFNADEADFMRAVVDVFIPKDDVGPGGVESGVVEFIDRQLAGAFGNSAHQYTQGPFGEGTPEQGYQLALTPADFFRIGIAEMDRHCMSAHGAVFAKLDAHRRDAILHEVRGGKIRLPSVPARGFLSLLFNSTMDGYFSDPIHGGNRNLGSWKMLGFPGPFRIYSEEIGRNRNRKFAAESRGISDLT